MTHVIKGTETSPKNSTFIGLFNQFTKVPVKDYVFTRMTKTILQELALCVLQELILYGPARAQNLTLVVVETKAGGKTVAIEKDEFPVSPEFVSDIDEAFFKLSDITGFSPDKQVASGQGHDAPYVLPNPDGFFTLNGGYQIPGTFPQPSLVSPPGGFPLTTRNGDAGTSRGTRLRRNTSGCWK